MPPSRALKRMQEKGLTIIALENCHSGGAADAAKEGNLFVQIE